MRLTLRGLRVRTPTSPHPATLSAPCLTSLTLSSLDISPSHLSSFLNPKTLPSLTTLSLQSIHIHPSSLSSISPQIKILSLQSQELSLPSPDETTVQQWPALEAYNNGWGMGLHVTLKVLGTAPIRFLRLEEDQQDLENDLEGLVRGIERGVSWVQDLRELVFVRLNSDSDGRGDPGRFWRNLDGVRETGVKVRVGRKGSFGEWAEGVRKKGSRRPEEGKCMRHMVCITRKPCPTRGKGYAGLACLLPPVLSK